MNALPADLRLQDQIEARLAVLQQATAILATSQRLDEAMPRILQLVCENLDWVWAGSWALDPGREKLRLDACWHVPSRALPELERVSRPMVLAPNAGLPGRVWASGLPLWIKDATADDDSVRAAAARPLGLRASFAVPYGLEDDFRGVMEFYSPFAQPVDEGILSLLGWLGSEIGQFLRRIEGGTDSPRSDADTDARRMAFLASAGGLLASWIDYESTLELLPRLAVPMLGDFALLDVADRRGRLIRVAVAHADPTQEAPPRAMKLPLAAPLSSPVLCTDATEAALAACLGDGDEVRLLRSLGTRSLMRLPLRAFGSLTLVRTRTLRPYEPADLALAEEFAWRAAITIEKARLHRETEQAVHVRDKFLSIVSHDLANPLQVIEMNARLLGEGPVTGPALEKGLARILRASTRMRSLIRELIDVARLQAGQSLELERTWVDLVPLVTEVVEELRNDAADRPILVDTPAPQLMGLFDRKRMERVIAHLIGNAIAYSPPGRPIRVTLASEPGREPGRLWAIVRVSDAGIGIPSEDLPLIFDMFHRGRNVEGKIPGEGMGLASVRQVVTQHDGEVTVESVEGQGSTFTVRLPTEERGNSQTTTVRVLR